MQPFTNFSTARYRFGLRGLPSSLKDFQAPMFSQVVRRVCARCNNGWMADLEESMHSLCATMAGRRHVLLGQDEQATLTRWLLKTGMVMALLIDDEATDIDPDHYRMLSDGILPNNSSVWLGRCADPEVGAGAWIQRFDWERRDLPSEFQDGYLLLVTALSLVGIVIVMGGSTETPPAVKMGPRLLTSFHRIWPTSRNYSVVWPPPGGIGLDDIDALLTQFRELGRGLAAA